LSNRSGVLPDIQSTAPQHCRENSTNAVRRLALNGEIEQNV